MGLFDIFKKKDNNVGQSTANYSIHEQVQPIVYDTRNFEFIVEDVFSISGRGTVVTGRVIMGTLMVGDAVTLLNAGITTNVVGIEMFRKTLDSVSAGENAGLFLRNVGKREVIRGEIIYK